MARSFLIALIVAIATTGCISTEERNQMKQVGRDATPICRAHAFKIAPIRNQEVEKKRYTYQCKETGGFTCQTTGITTDCEPKKSCGSVWVPYTVTTDVNRRSREQVFDSCIESYCKRNFGEEDCCGIYCKL